jgi:hypothetical protein
MMCGTAENRFLEWRATVAVCQNSSNKQILDTSAWLLGRFLRQGMLNLLELS